MSGTLKNLLHHYGISPFHLALVLRKAEQLLGHENQHVELVLVGVQVD